MSSVSSVSILSDAAVFGHYYTKLSGTEIRSTGRRVMDGGMDGLNSSPQTSPALIMTLSLTPSRLKISAP